MQGGRCRLSGLRTAEAQPLSTPQPCPHHTVRNPAPQAFGGRSISPGPRSPRAGSRGMCQKDTGVRGCVLATRVPAAAVE